MYTQCPQCRTIFEIDEDALQASLGIVCCGHCQQRFDALRTLSDVLPLETEAALPEHAPEVRAPTLTEAVTPDAIKAAAQSRRKRKQAPPPDASAPTAPPTTLSEDDWFAADNARTRALIADAAGIPEEAIQGDPAWQVVEPPIQASFAELDRISPTPTEHPLEIVPVDLPLPSAEPEPSTASDVASLATPEAGAAQTESVSAPIAAANTADTTHAEAHVEFEDDSPDLFDDRLITPAPLPAIQPAPAAHVYVPPRRHGIRRSSWLWAFGCLLLALTLAAQLAWARRVALVLNPVTQPRVLQLCAQFDCRLPPIRDTTQLELLSRDIRPDPAAQGALLITASVRNNAPFRQPWPVVVVALTDLDNNEVAMRRFRPTEYMPDRARRAAGIAAGATVAVAFEVADPGKRAVAFRFSFD